MLYSKHAITRQNQRGISKALIEATITFGEQRGDKTILTPKRAKQYVRDLTKACVENRNRILQKQIRSIKKICDKGGLVAVTCGDLVITTYKFDKRRMWQ
jgi:polyhydroxyalkanoate synthesis regulator phasin